MRGLMLYAVTTLLILTSSAMAAITATLKAGPTNALGTTEGAGSLYTIPATGARFDISVTLDRLSSDPWMRGMQMQFVSNGNGAATLNRLEGGVTSAGTSTRINTPEWDGDEHCASTITAPLTAIPGSFYVCGYHANGGLWVTSHTLMGFINVTVGTTTSERTFTITPVNAGGTDQDFNDVPAQGVAVTIHQLPEPVSALLLFGGLPSFRRRRSGG